MLNKKILQAVQSLYSGWFGNMKYDRQSINQHGMTLDLGELTSKLVNWAQFLKAQLS